MQLTYLAYLSAFAALFAWVMALGELAVQGRNIRNKLLFSIFLILGLDYSQNFFLLSGSYRLYPIFYQWAEAPMFCLGPLVYFYFSLSLKDEDKKSGAGLPRAFWFHLLPGLLVLIYMLPLYLSPDAQKLIRAEALMNREFIGPRDAMLIFHNIHFAVYLFLIFHRFRFLLNPQTFQSERAVRLLLYFTSAGALLTVFALMGLLLNSIAFVRILAATSTLIPPAIYLVERRHPGFFQELAQLNAVEKYRQSQLKGVPLERLQQNLETLFQNEKIYIDENLGLKSLAARLNISPHQLSEYFNNRLKTNFAGYVNQFRLAEARKRLKENPEESILSIAFAAGFNSKSHFNSVFARETGMTPTQFRKGKVQET